MTYKIPYRPPSQKRDCDYIRQNAQAFVDLFCAGMSWKGIANEVQSAYGIKIVDQAFCNELSKLIPAEYKRMKPQQRIAKFILKKSSHE